MSNTKIDFNHVCRTCTTQNDLKPLFDNIEILTMLEAITQLQFSRADDLPNKICANCLTKTVDCFNFVNQCKIADEKYRKLKTEIDDLKTEELLHSSIDIKDDDVVEGGLDPIHIENIKEIELKQSEYYILQWGSGAQNSEARKNFQVGKFDKTNEQGLMEQQVMRRIQAMERLNRIRSKHSDDLDEGHRTRAKLTLPHEEHNYIIRRNLEPPERITLRRALAREQMRKYRSKLTAEATERMRKYRAVNPPQTSLPNIQSPQLIPLRLSEMAQTLLRPPPLNTLHPLHPLHPQQYPLHPHPPPQEKEIFPRFSLRPTKIPQVKKQCFEVRTNENQVRNLRTWKRQKDTTDEVTIRLAKTALQMKKLHSMMKEPGIVVEEGQNALQRAKAAGQLRQYRPMLRKNKNIPVPTVHK